MRLYQLLYLLKRAMGGIRRRPWLHFFSVLTLSATFLSFSATLVAAMNLERLLERWIGTAQLTVYIKEGVEDGDVEKLMAAIREIPEVERIELTTPESARSRFSEEMGQYRDMVTSLPVSAFPASVDVHLAPLAAVNKQMREALAKRIGQVSMVEEVDQYDEWFERLNAIAALGRGATWGIGLLAFVVTVLVVAAVIKSGVSSRAKEIEVLGFVGASHHYIRLPFELEGAIEAAAAMVIAMIALYVLSGYVEDTLRDILPLIGVGGLMSLEARAVALLIVGSAVGGLIGSRLSLRGIAGV